MFAEFDLDSKYGKRALKRLYTALESNVALQSEASGSVSIASALPSRKTKEVIEQFIKEMVRDGDPMVAKIPADEESRHGVLLTVAYLELELVGLNAELRKKADVRVFLNRLAGVAVTRQNFVFSLFMSTLDIVIASAKATGEFEGTAEDITATHIQIRKEIPLAIDPASGSQTKLEILSADRGISPESVSKMAVEDALTKYLSEKQIKPTTKEEDSNEKGEECDLNIDSKDKIAHQGFYVSRNKIAGRYLIMYAKHKFDRTSLESNEAAADFDPLGLMVIVRPNTGVGGEMSTRDLRRKYNLILSCESIRATLNDNTSPSEESACADIVRNVNSEVTKLWKEAYENSNNFFHSNGLAPRRAELGLVTGPCLHVLPALEKAVLHRGEKDRALKIMRAQVGGDRRIVGVRFPVDDDDTIQKLQADLSALLVARNSSSNAPSFVDEEMSPVCAKSLQWITAERKTIKSFFVVKSSPSKVPVRRVSPESSVSGISSQGKRKANTSTKAPTTTKKPKTIQSFFKPVKKK